MTRITTFLKQLSRRRPEMNLTRRFGLFAALLTLLALLPGAAAAAPPAAAADQAGAAPLPVAEPESVGMSSERLQRLSDVMAGYIDRKQVAGTVTLVARRGKVVHFEAQGDRWPEEGAPMTRDTIFRIASMTKPIASVALMTLYEEGRFQLRDPIAKYLPERCSPAANWTGIECSAARPSN